MSTLLDGTEASGSGPGYAAGGSSGYEDDVSLASNDSYGPSSKRAKVTTSGRKRSKPTGKFRTSWKLPEYITASKRGNTCVYCKLCVSDFNITHSGLNDIKRHVEGTKHQSKLKDLSTNSTLVSSYGNQRRAHEKCVISAEIMMVQFIAMHNLAFEAADHLSTLFPAMFPDSNIATDFACKHTKTKAIICDTLDPHFKKPIIETIREHPFNLLCDESDERGDSVKLLTILVRFFDPSNMLVVTRHLDTIGITDCSAEGVYVGLKQTLERFQVPFSNLISFTSDTCNIMKGCRNGVIAKLRESQSSIIDVYCICHLLNLCVKSAMKTLPLKVDDLMVDVFYYFRNSVKRVTALQEYATFCDSEYKTVLKHSETRWLSLRRAVVRMLDIWDCLCSYFRSHADVDKPGKVKSICLILNHPLAKPWLCFLRNILTNSVSTFGHPLLQLFTKSVVRLCA